MIVVLQKLNELLHTMQTFGSLLGSEILHLKTFQQKQTRVSKAMCESADDILSQSVELNIIQSGGLS